MTDSVDPTQMSNDDLELFRGRVQRSTCPPTFGS